MGVEVISDPEHPLFGKNAKYGFPDVNQKDKNNNNGNQSEKNDEKNKIENQSEVNVDKKDEKDENDKNENQSGKEAVKNEKRFEFRPGDNINYPKVGDRVFIHYDGYLRNDKGIKGDKFDSSIDRKRIFECKVGVGQLIRGWDEGIPKLSLGQKATIVVTSDYAYGQSGFGTVIPPNSSLIFDVELLGINDLLIEPPPEKKSSEQQNNQNNQSDDCL